MRAIVRVPATVANLGPGFDMLALALQLQNEVHATTRDGAEIVIEGVGDDPELRDPARNLVARAYAEACGRIGVSPDARGVGLRCSNVIPFSRGLGSSAAAALSGVLVAVALNRAPWEVAEIIACTASFEGHSDNVAAALLGGLAIWAPEAEAQRIDVPDEVVAVVFAPDQRLATSEARRVVSTTLDRGDAIFNAARCALLVRAFLQRDYGALREAMDDRWHQRQRAALVPALPDLMAAAYAAGADGVCLAGAGPSVLALSAHGTAEVEAAFAETATRLNIDGQVMVLRVRNFGARVEVAP
ncbi:MAG: homoserine kinase [Candidatus Dormibacteraeota bacterium]|nr:homoserine kinase [Candidatus Dormibacteraeota bacterium]